MTNGPTARWWRVSSSANLRSCRLTESDPQVGPLWGIVGNRLELAVHEPVDQVNRAQHAAAAFAGIPMASPREQGQLDDATGMAIGFYKALSRAWRHDVVVRPLEDQCGWQRNGLATFE